MRCSNCPPILRDSVVEIVQFGARYSPTNFFWKYFVGVLLIS